MTELSLRDALAYLPKRRDESNKGDYGMLLSIVGSGYYRGAAVLSSMGALRTGVGILRVASTEKVISVLAGSVSEAVFLPLEEGRSGEIEGFDIKKYFNAFARTTAILCGCGLTVSENITDTVVSLVLNSPVPMVLDADALNALEGRREVLKNKASDIIITPHIGEFARLTGKGIDEIKKSPEDYALEFADKYSITVVLKSNNTIIASEKESYISRFGNPGLARGGSGDILAGMTASFLAQGLSPKHAAILATVLHGSAADRCAKRLSMTGMLPSDILDDLCEIFKEEGR